MVSLSIEDLIRQKAESKSSRESWQDHLDLVEV
jgi:hypothetical protein